MNTEIMAKLLLLVVLLLRESHVVSVLYQEDLLHRGTGLDYSGRNNSDFFNNHTVTLIRRIILYPHK